MDETTAGPATTPAPPAATPGGSGHRTSLALAALASAVVAALLGAWGLTRDTMISGEAATLFAARMHPHQLAHLLRHVDAVHGVYYAAMHVLYLAGFGLHAMRAVSLVGAVLAAAAAVPLGHRLTGSRTAALFTGLVTATAPVLTEYAKIARSYAFVAFLVILVVLAFCVAVDRCAAGTGSAWRWAVYAVLVVVTGWIHELSVLMVVAFAIAVLAHPARRLLWRPWLISSVIAVVLVSPLVYLSSQENAALNYLHVPGPFSALRHTAKVLLGVSLAVSVLFAVLAVVAILPVRLTGQGSASDGGRLRPWPGDRPLTPLTVALPLVVVAPVLLYAESLVAQPVFDVRYLVYYIPIAAVLVGAGLARVLGAVAARLPGSAALTAVAGVVVIAACFGVQFDRIEAYTSFRAYPQNYGAVARVMAADSRPGDAVVYNPRGFRYLPDGYPFLARRLDDVALRETPLASGTFWGHSLAPKAAVARLLTHRRVWVLGRSHPVAAPLTEALAAALAAHYRLAADHHVKGIDVRLYVRAA